MEDKPVCETCEGQGFLICGNCDAYEKLEDEKATLQAQVAGIREKIISDIWRPSPFFSDTQICRYCGMNRVVIETEGKHRSDCLITFLSLTPTTATTKAIAALEEKPCPALIQSSRK